MEMTDYAERNGPSVIDAEQLASLRKAAMQIRVSSLVRLGKHGT
jgi:hypothetical protein